MPFRFIPSSLVKLAFVVCLQFVSSMAFASQELSTAEADRITRAITTAQNQLLQANAQLLQANALGGQLSLSEANASIQTQVNALLAKITELQEENIIFAERTRLVVERKRQQDARLNEMIQLLKLVQEQTAPGPQINFGLNTDSDAASQDSFGGGSTGGN